MCERLSVQNDTAAHFEKIRGKREPLRGPSRIIYYSKKAEENACRISVLCIIEKYLRLGVVEGGENEKISISASF